MIVVSYRQKTTDRPIGVYSLLAPPQPPVDPSDKARAYYERAYVCRVTTTYALPHEKSAFGLFTKSPPLEVVSPSATRSPLGSCSFAKRAEVASMRRLRQIVHEASGGIAVVLAKQFRVGPLQRRQPWEKE
jgi:hypothetical protein